MSPLSVKGWCVAVHVYADESGKFNSSERVAFAGWLSEMDAWQGFDQNWRALLHKHGIQFIHTAKLMSHNSTYQGTEFSTNDKLRLLGECLVLANKACPILVFSAIDCLAFKEMPKKVRKQFSGSAHVMCFTAFLHLMIAAMENAAGGKNHNVAALIFDDNPEYAAECYKIFSKSRQKYPAWHSWIKSICFSDDEFNSPLQAADVLAWVAQQKLETVLASAAFVTESQIDELMRLAGNGITTIAFNFDTPAVKFIGQEMDRGRSFIDIVRVESVAGLKTDEGGGRGVFQ